MKTITLISLASAVAFSAGMAAQYVLTPHSGAIAADAQEKKPLYWVAPMDPNYRRDQPGKSPMGMDLVPVYEETTAKDDTPGTVTISPAVENNLGVRTEQVSVKSLEAQIRTVGRIGYNEDSLLQINSRVEGWVENLQLSSVGDDVRKGDKLFDLYSPALVNAQEELLSALRSGNTGLIKASRERLAALDVPEQTIRRIVNNRRIERTLSVYAPQDGYVSQLNIREGGYINPSSLLVELASMASVWVVADVFERQSPLIRAGQAATMTVDYLPGKAWQGTVDYVYPELDAQTRSLRVRLRFDNPDDALKPNMYSRVSIVTDAFEALTIPREALIQTGDQERVVKALGNGQFRSVRVDSGRAVDGQVEILRGLYQGERVVTSAQFLLDSESSVTADLSRYESSVRDRVWAAGTLDQKNDGVLTITHEPVPEWGWPAMTMDFDLSPEVGILVFDEGQVIRFEMEKTSAGGYRVVSMAKGEMNHETMDHSQMNHGEMSHEMMDHSQMNHGEMNHDMMDHSQMNHGEMNHDMMDHSQMNHGEMNHDMMDHSQMNHGEMNHDMMDHSQTNHGEMNHDTMDHSPMNHGEMNHDMMDHSQMGH